MNYQQFCDAVVQADGLPERLKQVYDQMQAQQKRGLTMVIEGMPYKKYWPAEVIEYIKGLSPIPTTEPMQSIAEPALPELPEPRKPDEHGVGWFTAGQMYVFRDEGIAYYELVRNARRI